MQRVRDFLRAKSKQDMAGKVSLRQQRLANKHHLLCIDHGLQCGVGFGLGKFMDDRPLRALREGETRYWCSLAEMPEQLRDTARGRTRRSCISDEASGACRLEVNWGRQQSAFVAFLDQGSIGWQSKHWLFMESDCRGWFFPDPAHRRHDSFNNAINEAHLAFIKYDASLIINLGSGPWGSCAHYGKYSEAAAEFFSNMSPTDSLFQEVYPFLVFRRFGAESSGEQRKADFVQCVWDFGTSNELFQKKGSKAQQNRWFQWTRRWREVKENIGYLLLVLLYQGLTLGWWATLGESPLQRWERRLAEAAAPPFRQGGCGGGEVVEVVAAAPRFSAPSGQVDVGEAVAPGRSVGQSNRGLDKWAGKRNAMQVVADIICNAPTIALADAIAEMTEPIDRAHGQALTMMKTPRGSVGGLRMASVSSPGAWVAGAGAAVSRCWQCRLEGVFGRGACARARRSTSDASVSG